MVEVICGSNEFLMREKLGERMRDFIDEYGDISLEKIDCDEAMLATVIEAVQSLPFLAAKKMVVLRGLGANKALSQDFEQILSALADSTELIIYESKPDKRSVYYKTLKKIKNFHEFNELDANELVKWLLQTAKQNQAELSSTDARYLLDRVGPNQQMLDSELRKLILYSNQITKDNIDLLVEPSPRGSVFELLEAAFAGDSKKANDLYIKQRQQKVEPLAILAMIGWQLNVLTLIKLAGQRTPGQIASETGMSPFVINKSLSVARALTMEQLKNLVHKTLKLDVQLKSESIDADEALQNLLISITQSQE